MPGRKTQDEFSEVQRAEIFARDRALCAYSGRSLWLADMGAAPYAVDWVDHIKPVARGGAPTVDNGVTCSHLYNQRKGARAGTVMLFFAGRPTADFFTYHQALTPALAGHLQRFARLVPSDWYFNRGLFHVLFGAAVVKATRRDGVPFTRGVDYRAATALRLFDDWRQRSGETRDLKARGLLPQRPSPDQVLLISAAQASSTVAMKRLVRDLAPWVLQSWNALEQFAEVSNREEAKAFVRAVSLLPCVSRSVKATIAGNARLLFPPQSAGGRSKSAS